MIRFALYLFLAAVASMDDSLLKFERQHSRTARVLNGQDASTIDYPYMLIFFYVDSHERGSMCGATIIAEEWAITSAHCVLNLPVDQLHIHTNITDLTQESLEVGVERVVTHPLCNITDGFADYDIALMKVNPAFIFGSGIYPVDLPDQDQEMPPGANGIITGWGQAVKDEDYPSPSEILQVGTVQLMNQSDCVDIFAQAPPPLASKVTDRMICAMGVSSDCMGDSGGPLVVDDQLVGIVSWGSEKCYDYPIVYTRVAFFRDWIKNITGV